MKPAERDEKDATRGFVRPAAATVASATVNASVGDGGDDDPRLMAAVQEYMALLESGRRPSRHEFLNRYPDIRDDLAACLDGLAFVHSAAAQMKGDAGPAGAARRAEEHPDLEPATAQPLGDFKLLRVIGRGGMGVVYEAVQLSLGRRVAIKVLPLAAALDARQLQRFRNEAQAAAQLHHTNIVPVYAVGAERGVHFYAMQLIEGQSLSDVIRDLRRAAGRGPAFGGRFAASASQSPRSARHVSAARAAGPAGPDDATASWRPGSSIVGNLEPAGVAPDSMLRPMPSSAAGASLLASLPADNLTTMRAAGKRADFFRTVARLGLQAAEALEYAHNLGVVHRDIKPGNLLLDGRGNLWITDFGLAQFYAQGELTQPGDLLGTLRYMSPEQASGKAVVLDQRTDVYSLGVTLYELLTLEPALPGETHQQLLREIGTLDPRPPRSIDRTIPVELETILAKAASKDAADRYQTAAAFAEDLRRFLRDEPILARPPSLWDKTVKWTRRHRAVAVSAVVVLVLAAAGLATSTLLIAREKGKTEVAYLAEQQRSTEAQQQRARAEQSFREARQAVDFFTGIAADRLGEMPWMADVRKEMLDVSLGYYQGFLDQRKDDPTIAPELNRARLRVTAIVKELEAMAGYFRVADRAKVLGADAVQADLKLSEDQLNNLAPILRAVRGGGPFGPGFDPREMSNLSPEEKLEMWNDRAAELESKLNAVLTVGQYGRLREIALQVKGAQALTDEEVAKALGLTREQKEAIRRIQADGDRKVRDTMNAMMRPPALPPPPDEPGEGDRGPGDRGPADRGPADRGPADRGPGPDRRNEMLIIIKMSPEVQKIADESMRQALAVLTPDQARTWRSLTGEPFKGSAVQVWMQTFPRFVGHGPGGPGGGRGGPGPKGGRGGRGGGGIAPPPDGFKGFEGRRFDRPADDGGGPGTDAPSPSPDR